MNARLVPRVAALGIVAAILAVLAGTARLGSVATTTGPSARALVSTVPPGQGAGSSPTVPTLGPGLTPTSAEPAPSAPAPSATTPVPGSAGAPAVGGRFGLGLLIADRGGGRLLIVNDAKRILWRFPGPTSLQKGQQFSADDAFIAPDGLTIVANDEAHQVIDRIDIATRRVIWQYGHYDRAGAGTGFLHTPDDAYPLANGDIVVADIRNCRILEINPAKEIVRRWGRAGSCSHRPPFSFNNPNGDTPLSDGGLLITEIGGSRVVRLSAAGKVIFDIHAPVRYPSDAQLDASGNVLVVDYSNPGAILQISPSGHVLWRYRPVRGPGRLDHPSLAIPLADGTIALNDDFRARVIVVDPRTNRIVWQYGHTDLRGRTSDHLVLPDGIDLVPIGTHL